MLALASITPLVMGWSSSSEDDNGGGVPYAEGLNQMGLDAYETGQVTQPYFSDGNLVTDQVRTGRRDAPNTPDGSLPKALVGEAVVSGSCYWIVKETNSRCYNRWSRLGHGIVTFSADNADICKAECMGTAYCPGTFCPGDRTKGKYCDLPYGANFPQSNSCSGYDIQNVHGSQYVSFNPSDGQCICVRMGYSCQVHDDFYDANNDGIPDASLENQQGFTTYEYTCRAGRLDSSESSENTVALVHYPYGAQAQTMHVPTACNPSTVCTAATIVQPAMDGCPRSGASFPRIWPSIMSLAAGARCCKNGVAKCKSSKCNKEYMTLADAVNFCTSKGTGWRLCTSQELSANKCCGAGGGCDARGVWTGDSWNLGYLAPPAWY